MPSARIPARLPADAPPRLTLLINVEEEFDWDEPFDRRATAFSHAEELVRLQDDLDGLGLVPAWLCTWPVAAHDEGAHALRTLAGAGRIVVGAHLHPWVSPPHEEVVDRRSSFPGNLPRELEAAKIARLTEHLEQASGVRPEVYQAGRYGLGPRTASILDELDYRVDMSICPPFDYSDEGGPDFSADAADPFWFETRRPVLGLPVTGAVVGAAGSLAGPLYRQASRPLARRLRGPGLLARLGLAERLRLSPEGFALEDMQRLTRALLRRGLQVFTLSFHSPSLRPGLTTYVSSVAEQQAFVDRLLAYVGWFVHTLGGRTSTPLALHDELLAASPPPPAAGH